MVAGIESILRPFRILGCARLAVTDVVLLRARPAHVVNAALFPGARLQMPPGTVKSRTFYGLRALRRVLAAHDAVA
jgi:hypothetical protein